MQEATARLDTLEDLAASNAEIRDNIAQKCSNLSDQFECIDSKLDVKERELRQICQGTEPSGLSDHPETQQLPI